jgi:2-oxoisovalerate ferredoxin oxidoreductase alpha subunit
MKKVITGNEAAAYACMQAGVQVVAAYPITPQTTVVEKIADFVGQGIFDAQYVKVESEHSAMAACIAASNTGVRTFTATSSHGLLLMHEMLHWAMAARVPVVMSNVNRANGPPWSVWAEHSDSIAQRDTGWLQFYAENNQEVLDTIIMCYRLCEQEDILLPAFVNEDAFILSHTSEVVDIPDREDVKKFLPDFDPPYKLDPDDPHGFGSLSMPHQWYMELRYNIADAMDKAYGRFPQVEKEFEAVFGRNRVCGNGGVHCQGSGGPDALRGEERGAGPPAHAEAVPGQRVQGARNPGQCPGGDGPRLQLRLRGPVLHRDQGCPL